MLTVILRTEHVPIPSNCQFQVRAKAGGYQCLTRQEYEEYALTQPSVGTTIAVVTGITMAIVLAAFIFARLLVAIIDRFF